MDGDSGRGCDHQRRPDHRSDDVRRRHRARDRRPPSPHRRRAENQHPRSHHPGDRADHLHPRHRHRGVHRTEPARGRDRPAPRCAGHQWCRRRPQPPARTRQPRRIGDDPRAAPDPARRSDRLQRRQRHRARHQRAFRGHPHPRRHDRLHPEPQDPRRTPGELHPRADAPHAAAGRRRLSHRPAHGPTRDDRSGEQHRGRRGAGERAGALLRGVGRPHGGPLLAPGRGARGARAAAGIDIAFPQVVVHPPKGTDEGGDGTTP